MSVQVAEQVHAVPPEPTPAAAARGRSLTEQIALDARARVIAAAAVVLVHAAYPPGHPAMAALPAPAGPLATWAFTLVVTFPVNAFVLLAFAGLAVRLDAGARPGRLLAMVARRMLPVHLFWTAVYLALRAAAAGAPPSPSAVLEGIVLGTAAAHLYFMPVLLALTAAAPLLGWLARTGRRAVAGGAALALAAIGLHALLRGHGPWARAAVGLLGLAPFALAGLALARRWGGVAPPPERRRRILRRAGALAWLAAGALLVPAFAGRVGSGAVIAWAAGIVYAVAVPVALLALPGRVPPRVLRLAACSLGVYLVHPIFIQALRLAEARIPALASAPLWLVLPNAALAAALSVAAVLALGRTPLRRLVM